MGGHQGQQGQAHYCLGTMQAKLRIRIRITDETHTPNIHQDLEETDTMQTQNTTGSGLQKHTVSGLLLGKSFCLGTMQGKLRIRIQIIR